MTMTTQQAEDLALRILDQFGPSKISIVDWADAITPFKPADVERGIAMLSTRNGRDWKLTTPGEFLSHVYRAPVPGPPVQPRGINRTQHTGFYGHLANLIERQREGLPDTHDELGHLTRPRLRNPDAFIAALDRSATKGDEAAQLVLDWFVTLLCELEQPATPAASNETSAA